MKRPLVWAALFWILLLLAGDAFGLPLREKSALACRLAEGEVREGTLSGLLSRVSRTSRGFSLRLEGAVYEGGGESLAAGTVLVYVRTAPEAPLGSVLACRGPVARFAPADNPGGFDARAYYAAQGMDLFQEAETVRLLGTAGRRPAAEAARRAAETLRARLTALFPPEEAGLLCALLLGDRSLLAEETEAAFSAAGTAHVLAVSGFHVSLCAGIVSRIFGFLLSLLPWERGSLFGGRGYLIFRALLSGAAVWFYLLLAGGSVSLKRAAVLFLLLLLSSAAGKSYDRPSALAAAALLVLIPCPEQLFQAAFQLSFGCAFVIGCVFPPVCRSLCLETPLGKALLLPVLLQLFVLPLTLWFYYEFHPWSVLTNLLTVPLAGWLIPLGFAALLAGGLWPPLGPAAVGPAVLAARLLLLLTRLAGRLPLATVVCGRPSRGRILLYYALAGLALTLLLRSRRRREAALGTLLGRAGEKSLARHLREGRQGGLAVLLLYGVLSLLFLPPGRGTLCFTSLYVGQGDCHVITTGEGSCFLVDGGSSYGSPAERDILPYLKFRGIRRIRAVFVSHCDTDHINGLAELLSAEGLRTELLLFSAAEEKNPAAQPLLEAAEKAGTAVRYLHAGDSLSEGALQITALLPETPSGSGNDDSLVLLFRQGAFSALYTGDIGAEREAELCRCPELAEGAVLLKAAHHGSRYSSSAALLRWIRPAAAVISCGRGNLYGHPAEETLARLRECGSAVYRTDLQGAVSFFAEEGGTLRAEVFRQRED